MPSLMINKGNQYRTLEVEMELLLVAEKKFWCMFFLLSTYMSFYVNVLYSMHFMYFALHYNCLRCASCKTNEQSSIFYKYT